MKGDTQERELMAVLRGHGFIPMRSPGSGTGDWEQPDVLAGQQGVVLAGELKSGANPRNLDEAEVDALERFADAFWAAALVAVRYKGDRTFYLVPPALLDRTDAGRYSLPSKPSTLPWVCALPYTKGDDGVEPRKDIGDQGIVYDTDEKPPTLADWLDTLTAEQQGFHVRRGIVDLNGGADDGGDGDG